eukprot:63880-Prymnesium_polylepis.1
MRCDPPAVRLRAARPPHASPATVATLHGRQLWCDPLWWSDPQLRCDPLRWSDLQLRCDPLRWSDPQLWCDPQMWSDRAPQYRTTGAAVAAAAPFRLPRSCCLRGR